MEKTKTKFYLTKKRKQQLLYWKVLTVVFFASTIVLGAVGTYTTKVMASGVSAVSVVHQEAVVVEPETLDQMVVRIAKEENFEWVDYMRRLIKCESNWNPSALNINNKGLGIDLGLLQLNTKFNPTITIHQMLDPEFSIRYAMQEILAGRQSRWICDRKIK